MPSHKIGVQMCQEHMPNLQVMFGGKCNVLVGVALWINHCRRARLLVSKNVRRMSQARQIELLEDHDTLPSRASTDFLVCSFATTVPGVYFGCGTIRRYGLGAFQPFGYFCLASSSETEGRIITSSPFFQFTGVATLCLAVSCIESTTRKTSSKLRPVLIG